MAEPRAGGPVVSPRFRAVVVAARADDQHGVPAPGEWVWPAWLEAVEAGRAAAGRWTTLGVLGRPAVAMVDPRGLVAPRGAAWSVDWWVQASDRWHLPARDVAVRQRAGDGPAVVETALRVPGGDVVHRCWTVAGPPDLLVVEVVNETPAPVALALAIRPYSPSGPGHVVDVAVAGTTVAVEGAPALVLDRPPVGAAASTGDRGDVAVTLMAEESRPTGAVADVHDRDGLATAVVVVPLPHRQSLRAVLPLTAVDPGALAPLRHRALPAADAVARGWRAQLRRGLRVYVPDPRLVAAIDACRARQMVGPDVDPAAGTAEALRAATLHGWGLHAEATGLGTPVPAPPEGGLVPTPARPDARSPGAGTTVWSTAEAWRLSGDPALAARVAGTTATLLASGAVPRGAGAHGPVAGPLWWLRGLVAAVPALVAAGVDPREVVAAADALRPGVAALVAAAPALAAWPGDPPSAASVDGLLALVVGPDLGLGVDRPALVAATVAGCGEELAGDPRAALGAARALVDVAPAEAWARLGAVLDLASPTWTWPDLLDPDTGGADGALGDDPAVAAAVLAVVRDLLVGERGDGRLVLVADLPAGWEGQGVEVHDAPVAGGTLSYAVRWHGDRPALLWEAPGDDVVLTAPGLDPTWSGAGRSGEALLAPFTRPT